MEGEGEGRERKGNRPVRVRRAGAGAARSVSACGASSPPPRKCARIRPSRRLRLRHRRGPPPLLRHLYARHPILQTTRSGIATIPTNVIPDREDAKRASFTPRPTGLISRVIQSEFPAIQGPCVGGSNAHFLQVSNCAVDVLHDKFVGAHGLMKASLTLSKPFLRAVGP